MRKKTDLKNIIIALPATGLLSFMLVIFGPAEIYFKNYLELGFVFGEFGWRFLVWGILFAVLSALILSLLPDSLRKVLLGIITGVSLSAYVQYLFLNNGITILGEIAEAFVPSQEQVLKNSVIWGIITTAVLAFEMWIKDWRKPILSISTFLLVVQFVAYISLFVTADLDAFSYQERDPYVLSGQGQYTVSSNENVLVITLDCLSNAYLEEYRKYNDDWLEVMKDFTYYNNADCGVFGTFPSTVHLYTGFPLDITLPVNEYIEKCWTNDKTRNYFNLLKEKNYKINVFIDGTQYLVGGCGLGVMCDKVDNVKLRNEEVTIDYKHMNIVLLKMALYRYSPVIVKRFFYVTNDSYRSIATTSSGKPASLNYEFYDGLITQGLNVDSEYNYYNYIHLNGTHELINNEKCEKQSVKERNTCIQGIFFMLGEYFEQLKKLEVYDKSTIIVMSDHGSLWDGQPIFFIKEKGENKENMGENNAPIDYDALVPTIVETIGGDSQEYGNTIYVYGSDEVRERVFYERMLDSDYKLVEKANSKGYGTTNVYHVIKYKGDRNTFYEEYLNGEHDIYPMIDSFY